MIDEARHHNHHAPTENTQQHIIHARFTADDLKTFAPKCAICGTPITEERQKRRKKTCSDEHTKLLMQWTRHYRSKIRCVACYRPSTPEERAEFKAWRQSRGEILRDIAKDKGGRPSKKRERELEDGIREVIQRYQQAEYAGDDDAYAAAVIISSLEILLQPNNQA